MNRRQMLASSLAAPLLAQTSGAQSSGSGSAADRQFYELRWFYLRNGQNAPRMMDLLKNHWGPTAKKLGTNPSFFQPTIGDLNPSVLVLSPFRSAEDAATSMERMLADADFASAYRQANTPEPAFTRSDVTLLRAFAGMPVLAAPNPLERGSHIFEMRTYESNSQQTLATKLEMFNGGEIGVFQRLGMSPVFFGEGVFGRNLPSLTYMLAFESLAARENLWKQFVADAEFTKLRTKPGYSDPDIVSTISNSILAPLPYSAVR